jgi:hypothetical protein
MLRKMRLETIKQKLENKIKEFGHTQSMGYTLDDKHDLLKKTAGNDRSNGNTRKKT